MWSKVPPTVSFEVASTARWSMILPNARPKVLSSGSSGGRLATLKAGFADLQTCKVSYVIWDFGPLTQVCDGETDLAQLDSVIKAAMPDASKALVQLINWNLRGPLATLVRLSDY